MKKFIILSSLLFLITFISTVYAQDENYQEDMNKAWTEYMTPGPMHELLAKGTGEWTGEIKMWMDPDQPPTESKGTSVIKSILGGRYFEGTHTSDFNGMEMNGMDITGYDNAKKKFFNTWIDNFGTGIMHLEGTYDEGTKTFTYKGTSVDPMTGKDVPIRQVTKILDDDHQHMEMYMTDNGQEFKTMEIDFTRNK
ncbi:MAG TPA: DUF1579 domain-containing protein [Ignavibacteriaceae bacterium]|nr:DUF1579 domain-containing protein [Ignavibacteriaceae bacterium]